MAWGDGPDLRLPGAAFAVMLLASVVLAGCDKAAAPAPARPAPTEDKVELTPSQLKTIEVETIPDHVFSPQRTAVGSIDFDEDRAVQVYPNYQGKIIEAYDQVGDEVRKGKALYTIDSPDLVQAESTLIAAAGVYDLTTEALERDRKLHEKQALADKDLQQAISDQMTAEGNLRAARAALAVFGKTAGQIDAIVKSRKIDPALVVASPLSGRVTARNAQPGLLVQPGTAPAPFAVADTSVMWMIANVNEADVPLFRKGDPVRVKVDAYGDHDFKGAVDVIGASLDPNTHTEMVRTVVQDPRHELRPGMLATYVIQVGAPVRSIAVPADGVVRNGDGAMSVWVTADDRHFNRRMVKLGLLQDGFDQILSGVQPGERVVVKGAVFLSNMANAASSGDD
jgi:cobalt-zinc-cadmium efflux system membrane fusion protein